MRNVVCLAGAGLLLSSLALAAEEKKEKVTYQDHVLPILESNCLNCHNPDESKGGLDLSTYAALLTGGSGGKVAETQDTDGSRLFTLMAHLEEPHMPPNKPKTSEKELAVIAEWIMGGLLETSSSTAKKSDKPKLDLTMVTTTSKPEGPPPMPEHIILEPEIVTERPNAVPALAHSPWAPIVAVAGQKQVILYHSEDFDVLGILPYPEGFPQSLSFSSSGAILQAGGGRGGKSGNVVAWDVKTGERLFEVGREFDIVLGSDISPDHRRVVLGGPGRIFKIWDTVTGEQVNAVKKHPDWVLAADFSPDGILLATGGRNSGLYVWEAESGLEFYTLKGHAEAVTDLAWRPDSNILASISEDGQAILWDMKSGREVKKWNAHGDGGLAVDFSPDGQLIATAGRDKKVKIWKGDGSPLRTIDASDDIVMSVAFTHDSERVISGDFRGNIKVWSVDGGKELAELDANPPTIGDQITAAERRIEEINASLPQLEKNAAEAKGQVAQAREKLREISGTFEDLTREKTAAEEGASALKSKVESLAKARQAAEEEMNRNRGLVDKLAAELTAAEASLDSAGKARAAARADLERLEAVLAQADADLEKTRSQATAPVFDDAEKEKAFVAARAARDSAAEALRKAERIVAEREEASQPLLSALRRHQENLADQSRRISTLQERRQKAQLSLADARSELPREAGSSTDAEQEKRRREAERLIAGAEDELQNADRSLHEAESRGVSLEQAVKAAESALDGPKKQLEHALATRSAATEALARAQTALQPFLEAGADRIKAAAKAQDALHAKVAARDKASAERDRARAQLENSMNLLARAEQEHRAALSALEAAKEKARSSTLAFTEQRDAFTEADAALKAASAKLDDWNKKVETAATQKEARSKAVAAAVEKEQGAIQAVETAKADLEENEFLVRKFRAAALNYAARIEAKKLEAMTGQLDGMLGEVEAAARDVEAASRARIDAEKTLAEAENAVASGREKLAATTDEVLDRAIQLIATRAAAGLRETVASDERPAPTLTAESPTPETLRALVPGDSPEDSEVVEVVSSALGEKTADEIREEISQIRERLAELTTAIEKAYQEANRTVETVEKASAVAEETPRVIAERTSQEKEKAERLRLLEDEKKAKERALQEKQKRIEELKKEYLATLPERD